MLGGFFCLFVLGFLWAFVCLGFFGCFFFVLQASHIFIFPLQDGNINCSLLTFHHFIHMLDASQSEVLQHSAMRESHSSVSEKWLWRGQALTGLSAPSLHRECGLKSLYQTCTLHSNATWGFVFAIGQILFTHSCGEICCLQWDLPPGKRLWRKTALAQEQTVALLTSKRCTFECKVGFSDI